MFDNEDDLAATFLEEAQNLLDDTEAAFIALDAGDHSPELVDKIFRLAHSFKSSAKTVGLQHLSDFAHVFEDVLIKIKDGSLRPERHVCTILLSTLDQFKSYVAGLKQDLAFKHDTTDILASLKSLLKPEADPETAIATEITLPLADPPPAPLPAKVEATPQMQTTSAGDPPHKPRVADDEMLKVSRNKLDSLLNLIGELVVNQSMVTGYRENGQLHSELSQHTLRAMEKIVLEIQNISTALRLTPISPLFKKVNRIARDAGTGLNKSIEFRSHGEHVEVDKIVLEKISDPLTHLVRNAVDHGIETDEQRSDLGKGTAVIELRAEQREDHIVISLADNGRGMDPAKLIAKAKEKGLVAENATLSDEDAYQLIFKAGFSTKEQVTDMSGRGVGMDVVQKAIEELRGRISIQTKLGEGTTFIIALPLSMSIISGMVVGIDDKKYVIPISQLVETVELNHFRLESSTETGRMFNLRGDVIPVYSLAEILHRRDLTSDVLHRPGLITQVDGKRFSFEIDRIYGQQQIVLKKLGREMDGLPGIVAGAILNTGEPGLVLNLSDFVRKDVTYAA